MEKAGLILCALILSGCSLVPWKAPKAPKATIRTAAGTITQSGDAATPAKLNTSTSKATLPIPAGSEVKVHAAKVEGAPPAPDPVSVTLSAPSVLSVESNAQGATAPQAFTPPAPPSPTDLAKGAGVRWFYIAGVLSGLAALFAFYRGHPVNGAILLAGAVVLPLVGNFVASEWAVRIAIVIGCLSAGLTVAWFVLRKHHPEYLAELRAKLPTNAP